MAGSQPGGFDALGDFVDLSQYENNSDLSFHVPSMSPSTSSSMSSSNMSPPVPLKSESSADTPSMFPTTDNFTGPSHQYDLYKQQTGLVPGALTTTLSLNQPQGFMHEFLNAAPQSNFDDLFDFNTAPQAMIDSSTLDLDFSTSSSDGLYVNPTINPNVIGGQEPESLPSPMPTPNANGGYPRVWPGMHQQAAALARQQQEQRLQQERQRVAAQQAKQVQKARSPQTSDSIAEQRVQTILNSIRADPPTYTPVKTSPAANFPKKQKTEAEMDEDEKFLASEEGKKLDSRERRQLRNKVSARAFRGRRKEYISWLEGQLTDKINEAGLLRAHNRALAEDNARLSGLTRMLLTSHHFQPLLLELSSNPEQLNHLKTAQQPAQQQPPLAQQQSHLPQAMLTEQQRSHHFQQQFQQHQACYAA